MDGVKVPQVALKATGTPLAKADLALAVTLTVVVPPAPRVVAPKARLLNETLVAEIPTSMEPVVSSAAALTLAAPTVDAVAGLTLTYATPSTPVWLEVGATVTAVAFTETEKLTSL
jgi:hypothetical protein